MEKKIVTLTREQFEIYRTCKVNPFYLANFVYIIHPVKGKVKFNLYEYQRAVLWNFLNNRFNIILKFRQAGLTELIAFFCLWLAMFNDNKNIQIISIKDMVAKRVLKRIKYMYKNLPEWLQTPVTQIRGDSFGTATVLEFVNGSSITSVPTTEEAGRSEAVSLLVIDEAAIVRWADRIWAAAFPTLSCITGNYELILKKFVKCPRTTNKVDEVIYKQKISDLCPTKVGVKDLWGEELYTLTHTGQWKRVRFSQYKGKLKTWKLIDEKGKVLDCTPWHKLLTPNGWLPVRDIIKNNLSVVQLDLGMDNLTTPPVTIPPTIEIKKPIPGFPRHWVSNLGKVYRQYTRTGEIVEIKPHLNKRWGLDVGLTLSKEDNNGINKTVTKSISRLVAEAFIGEIPEGYVVDHIDTDRTHNYVSNLQIITLSENTQRSKDFNIGDITSRVTSKVDIEKHYRVLQLHEEFPNYSHERIKNLLYTRYKIKMTRKSVGNILNGSKVYLSKLTLLEEYYDDIYDINVEDNHSYILTNNYINHNTGGSAILNSTPMGIGNFFHKQWVDAKNGDSYFNPIRLYWQMHPERNEEWYNSMAKSLGPRRTAQEIDGDFLSSGNTVFDLNCIRAIEECLPYPDDYLSIEQNGKLFIRRFAKPGERCFIGADVAIGRANDYSAFSVMNRYGEELAYFRGKINPSKYANLLMHTGKRFNNALIAPESNDIGLAVTSKIQDHGYPNLYYAKKLLKKKGKSKPEVEDIPGWYTTTSTRPIIIDELEEDIRFDQVNICNKFFVDESYTFIFDSRNRPVAMGKDKANDDNIYDDDAVYTDDCIMAEAITNYIRKGKKNLVTNPI